MVTSAHGNAFLIQNGTDVVRMNLIDYERKHTGLVASRANNP